MPNHPQQPNKIEINCIPNNIQGLQSEHEKKAEIIKAFSTFTEEKKFYSDLAFGTAKKKAKKTKKKLRKKERKN
jgi:hypothetical protein